MATRVIDDNKLQNIAVAIQSKDNGGQMTVDEMAGRIEAIPSGAPVVSNPALILWDWEGTKLAEYSYEDAMELLLPLLTGELPAPSTFPPYAGADHELLVLQSWNWNPGYIYEWLSSNKGKLLDVGTIYVTTDNVDHNFWNNPRLSGTNMISMQKRGNTTIAPSAFSNFYSLTHINLPAGVPNISTGAFSGCSSLTHINIPSSVRSIGDNAFSGCSSLTHISLSENVREIGAGAFGRCFSLTHISLPESVVSISNNAFIMCYSLTQITLPSAIKTIGASVFESCYSLTQINIPYSVSSIGDYAFRGCCSLTQINIPAGMKSIGTAAFLNCYVLCDILNESTAELSNTAAFKGLPAFYRVYVPRVNLSWFETATNWSAIYTEGHIVAIEDYIEYLESIGFNVDNYKGAA